MFGWLKPKRQGAEAIPPDLVAAIEAASVTFRDHGGEDGEGRLLVRVAGTGAWYWTGTNEAAERFQRMHGLPPGHRPQGCPHLGRRGVRPQSRRIPAAPAAAERMGF